MDHDKKIVSSKRHSRNIFLPDQIVETESHTRHYVLDEEFEKTKHNSSFKIYLAVGLFFFFVITVAWVFHKELVKKTQHVPINIADFEDVKLKEVIGSMSNIEHFIEDIQEEIHQLEENRQKNIKGIDSEFTRRRDYISLIGLPLEEREIRIEDLEKEKSLKLSDMNQEFNYIISQKKQHMESLKKEIEIETSKLKGKNDALELLSSSEEKLFKIKAEKMRRRYENQISDMQKKQGQEIEDLILLYNPIFEEQELGDILNESINPAELDMSSFPLQKQLLINEEIVTDKQLDMLSFDAANFESLLIRLTQIPFRNSMQKSVFHAKALNKRIVESFSDLNEQTLTKMTDYKSRAEKLSHTIDLLLKDKVECGYVTDKDTPEGLSANIKDAFKIKTGDTGYVFREPKEFVATVLFTVKGKNFFIKPIIPAMDIHPQAGDKILINISNQ